MQPRFPHLTMTQTDPVRLTPYQKASTPRPSRLDFLVSDRAPLFHIEQKTWPSSIVGMREFHSAPLIRSRKRSPMLAISACSTGWEMAMRIGSRHKRANLKNESARFKRSHLSEGSRIKYLFDPS
jgi:hypothetical protein